MGKGAGILPIGLCKCEHCFEKCGECDGLRALRRAWHFAKVTQRWKGFVLYSHNFMKVAGVADFAWEKWKANRFFFFVL